MKKLIMAVAVICAAAMVQAAQVDWKVSGAQANLGTKVYLLTSISATYESLAAFESSAVSYAEIAKQGRTYAATATAVSDSITSAAKFYFAVVNGDTINYVDASSDASAYVYTPPSSTPGTFAAPKFADISSSSTTAKIVGVPEPTSGLLLLLGFAGLALRRRRA